MYNSGLLYALLVFIDRICFTHCAFTYEHLIVPTAGILFLEGAYDHGTIPKQTPTRVFIWLCRRSHLNSPFAILSITLIHFGIPIPIW